MPSSLTVSRSSALVSSTRPRVSVCGTGAARLWLRGFSWESGYRRFPIARGLSVLSGSARRRHLARLRIPTPFNGLFRQSAGVSLLRLPVAARDSSGMLTASSIGCAFRLLLRSRLTLIRLALIRKPWSSGEGVSRPLCRYLYLHLLFHPLHRPSRGGFSAAMECSPTNPRIRGDSMSSAPCLCPIIIHAGPLD